MYVCRETSLMFSGGGGGGCNTILDVYYLYEKKLKTMTKRKLLKLLFNKNEKPRYYF